MFNKEKPKDERNTQPSLIDKVVEPVKRAVSYFSGLLGSNRGVVTITRSSGDKVSITKNTAFSTIANEPTEKFSKDKILNELSSHKQINSLKNLDVDFLRPHEHNNKKEFDNNIIKKNVGNDLPQLKLNEFEMNFLKYKNVKISENLVFSQIVEHDEQKKKIKEIISSIDYEIQNMGDYTQQQITLSKRIVDEENEKILKKHDLSRSLNLSTILRTRFDPGKIINEDCTRNMMADQSKMLSNNTSFQNLSDNHSTSSNCKTHSNYNLIRTDEEVSNSHPKKKLFHPNPKKNNYANHLSNCNIAKEDNERVTNLKREARCGGCGLKEYELNQYKLKLKDANIEIKKLQNNIKKNSFKSSSQEQTPSSINHNNSNLNYSMSFSMSHSKDSVTNSVMSEKVNLKLPHFEMDNRVGRKLKSSAILEEREEENRSASNDEFKKEKDSLKVVERKEITKDEEITKSKKEENIIIKNNLITLNLIKESSLEFIPSKKKLNDKIEKKFEDKINEETNRRVIQENKQVVDIGNSKAVEIESEKEVIVVKEENPLKSIKKDLIKNFNCSNSTTIPVIVEVNKKEELHNNINLNISNSNSLDSHLEEIESIKYKFPEGNIGEVKKFANETVPLVHDNKSKQKCIIIPISRKESEAVKEVVHESSLTTEKPVLNNSPDETITNSNINNVSSENQFTERPKGRAVNKIEISNNNNEVLQLDEQKTQMPINITQNIRPMCQELEAKEHQLKASDFMSKPTKNMLTDNKSNPFLMTIHQPNDNKLINQNLSIIVNNPSYATSNNFTSGNYYGQNLNSNNPINAINSIQTGSPASSTYSDVTFRNKNTFEYTTNQFNSNLLHSNTFSGTNVPLGISQIPNNMNNNFKNNLTTVCEDEGRMSVEKQDCSIVNNSNRETNWNFNSGANLLHTNNFPRSDPIHEVNLKLNATNDFQYPFQQKLNNQFSYNNNQFGRSNFNNNAHSIGSNAINNTNFGKTGNSMPFNNSTVQQENRSILPSAGPNVTNPFLSQINNNNNNNNSTSGRLGLFDEHEPQKRRHKK